MQLEYDISEDVQIGSNLSTLNLKQDISSQTLTFLIYVVNAEKIKNAFK